jgi:ribonuclease HIII
MTDDTHIFNTFPKIGSDEVGKGDFFGPLVVCAVYIKEPARVSELSARDSKTISDSRVEKLGMQLVKMVEYSLVRISPEKYNQLYQRFKNINVILGWAHAQAIKNVLEKQKNPKIILIDKFGPEFRVKKHFDDPGISEKMIFLNRAEQDTAVAVASIIARYTFLKEMGKLSSECGQKLPLGAGERVDMAAKELAAKIGLQNLSKYVKVHFKNYLRLT